MQAYRKKDMFRMPDKEDFVKEVKRLADQDLSHLFTLTEGEINQALTALAYYCSKKGSKATKQIYNNTLLQMIQYEEGACGHRFEIWAM